MWVFCFVLELIVCQCHIHAIASSLLSVVVVAYRSRMSTFVVKFAITSSRWRRSLLRTLTVVGPLMLLMSRTCDKTVSWGDDLTLTAAAHLLLKPIRIVSDLDIEEFREFHPPSSISPECWGPCITLAYLQFSHYEATEQVERNMKVKEVAPRSFKPSKKKTELEARVRRVKFEFHICGQWWLASWCRGQGT